MITLLAGSAAALLVWWLTKQYARANPAILAKALRRVAGIAAAGAAVLFLLRGRIDMAFLLGGGAAWLLGWSAFPGVRALPGFGGGAGRAPTPGAVSRVRSAMIEMELDHDTGDMNGTVLAGPFTGRRLAELDAGLLARLHGDCAGSDPEGVRLLEAYLDRRFPRWREDAQGDEDPGPGRQAQSGAMTEQEAYEILGLQPGADAEAVRGAHRTLMKKLHPDQGGSTYLAARVNQAKETLLGRHR
jgi:hypothetical protein